MRGVLRAIVVAAILLLALGGGAFAALRYDSAHADELLPGVRVGDVDGGGRPARAILEAMHDRLPSLGTTSLGVVAGTTEATVTLQELGLRSDAAEAMARAEADAEAMGVVRRLWHRLLDKPVNRTYPVRLHVERQAAERVLADLARQVDVAPVDARLDTSTGLVQVIPASTGRSLEAADAAERLHAMASRVANGEGDERVVHARVETISPKTTGFADVLLVRTAENKLYHYENGELVKTYPVATGTPRYPTPKGNFSVVLKRRNPTWVNPDPRGWGASLPARIGPGPRNPLGTRAMNLDAPGIRIHGTTNVASLGRAASHGCIRMSIPDSEELFDRVDQGTPVVIIQGPPPAAPAPVPGGTPLTTLGDPNAPVDLEAG